MNLSRTRSSIVALMAMLVLIPSLNGKIIVAPEATFIAPSAQPIFPSGNLNVFKQFVLGFEVSEEIGEKVEIDLLFTTLEFGGELELGVGAFFGLEFGLCLGGNANYDLRFAPQVTLPDVYPTELPIPITVAEGLKPASHFTTSFPPLGTMYADLILDLSAQLRAEACVFKCFTPIDIDFSTCELPLFNYSSRCDDALTQRKYCAIELASFNRDGNNKARMLNVTASNAAEFLAEPHLEYSLAPSLPIAGGYGTVSLGLPTINTDSRTSPFNTTQVLKSSGAEDVLGVGIDLAKLVADVLIPPTFPPLSESGSVGPIDWDYTIAALEVGPAIQLQTEFEMTWDLVVSEITFTDPATGSPKSVKLFTPSGSTHPINGVTTTKLTDTPGFSEGHYHLKNCGPLAMPMISLITDPFTPPVGNPNAPRPPQGEVKVDVTYKLIPKLMTVVSLPFVGKIDYEMLSAGAEISRVGDLRIGPLVEGSHKFKLGEFEVYRSQPSAIESQGTGAISFTMQAAGPPSYDWNPSQWTGTPTNSFLWTGISSTTTSNWQEIISQPIATNSFPGQAGASSSAMIHRSPSPKLKTSLEIASLQLTNGKFLSIQPATAPAVPELTVTGLVENTGSIFIDGKSSMRLNSADAVLCGTGNVWLSNGANLRGQSNANSFTFCNYNTLQGTGNAMYDYVRFDNRTTTHNLGEIRATAAGTNGSLQIDLSLTLDNFPDETTWELKDTSGTVLHNGGPYTTAGATVNQSFTLAEGSYFFTISDTEGDGICCGFGQGSYTLTNGAGSILASGGEFLFSEQKTVEALAGSYLKTGASKFINEGVLGATSGSRLIVDSDDLQNRLGSLTTADGGRIDLRARSVEHIGGIAAINSGRVFIKPLMTSDTAFWNAGQSFRDDCGGLSASSSGVIELVNTNMTGGCFFLTNFGNLTTSLSTYSGSVFEIGNSGDSTPSIDINGAKQLFTRSCLNNFGTLRVSGNAEFVDTMLFANHGTIVVPVGGELRVKENTATTPGASPEALLQPGLANATRNTLLGGKWDIAGKMFIEGADFTMIGADIAVATTGAGSVPIPVSGNPPPVPVFDPGEGASHILSNGAPAEVTLRGTFYQFLALNHLRVNCGLLNLVDGADFRPSVSTFTNNGQINVGTGSIFEPQTTYIQTRPGASLHLADGGHLRPGNFKYDISGGTITAVGINSIFHTFAGKIKSGADIRIASPIIDTNEAIYRLEKVIIDIPTLITTINSGAKLTIHGKAVEFDALYDNLALNEGTFIVSGDGVQNAPSLSIQDGFNEKLTNKGILKVKGDDTELIVQDYEQTGVSSETRVGPGAKLHVKSVLDINGGKIVFEIGSRPYLDFHGTITGQPHIANFNNLIVIDFVGDLAESMKTVDIGDTWDIMENQPVNISGISSVQFLVAGSAPLPDWLPANAHLELIQFNTPHGLRGLRVRVTPNGGFIAYDNWATTAGLDPATFVSDPFLDSTEPGVPNIMNFLYGDKAGTDQGQALEFVTGTDGQLYTEICFERPSGTDASYEPYYSLNLIHWRRAPMVLVPATGAPVALGQMEKVTMQSLYPAPDGKLFYRIQPAVNLENFDIGEHPDEPITWTGALNDFNQSLVNKGDVVSYNVVPGKTLYFNVNLPQNEDQDVIWGGTDGVTGERNFIYRDQTALKLAVRHAGLLKGGERGIIKVTFIAAQTEFFSSTQDDGTDEGITSKAATVFPAAPYSYRVDVVKIF